MNFLEKVSVFEQIGGWISHVFEYLSGSLKEVTFAVYAREDIPAADGESKDYYKKDELVATITTDDTGIAKISGLPLGKYYVKEKATEDGFVLDNEAREIDLTYRDQDTAEVTYSADWQNNRQKAEVEVVKKRKILIVYWKVRYLPSVSRMILQEQTEKLFWKRIL